MKKCIEHTVKDLLAPMRISTYLREQLGLSVTLVKRVKVGGVFLNGQNVHMRAEVKNGDTVEIFLPEEKSEGIPPIDLPLEILFEDEHMIAVCKPRNMPTHPSKGNSLPTLANAVMHYFGEAFVFRAITRLDRDTSGIVLIAKTQLAASRLSEDMKAGRFEKLYTAVVSGVPHPAKGRIDAPIRREREGEIRRIVAEDGKRAVTDYQTLSVRKDGNAVMQLSLLTGRTHQIRVQLSSRKMPLVGDGKYGASGDRQPIALFSSHLSFPHPVNGRRMCFDALPTGDIWDRFF